MNQSFQCPICGKEGIPDFHQEDVVCPCCGSDLSIYNRLREITEIRPINIGKGLNNKWLLQAVTLLLVVVFLLLVYLGYYKPKSKQEYRSEKETELIELKNKISILQDSISKLNSIILKDNLSSAGQEDSEANYRLYIVKKGDSLRKISRKQLGTEQRFEEIVNLNKLANITIHTGDTLKIPNK